MRANAGQVIARKVTGLHITPKGGAGLAARFTVTVYRALPSGRVGSKSIVVHAVRCKAPTAQVETHGNMTSLELRKPRRDRFGTLWDPQPVTARLVADESPPDRVPARTVLVVTLEA